MPQFAVRYAKQHPDDVDATDLSLTLESLDSAGNPTATLADKRPFIDALPRVNSGRYRLTVFAEEQMIGHVDLCTLGTLTGCDAEDVPDSDVPKVAIRKGANGDLEVILENNGPCP